AAALYRAQSHQARARGRPGSARLCQSADRAGVIPGGRCGRLGERARRLRDLPSDTAVLHHAAGLAWQSAAWSGREEAVRVGKSREGCLSPVDANSSRSVGWLSWPDLMRLTSSASLSQETASVAHNGLSC